MGEPNSHGPQYMRIVCLDQDAETVAFDSLGPEGEPSVVRTRGLGKQAAASPQ